MSLFDKWLRQIAQRPPQRLRVGEMDQVDAEVRRIACEAKVDLNDPATLRAVAFGTVLPTIVTEERLKVRLGRRDLGDDFVQVGNPMKIMAGLAWAQWLIARRVRGQS